MPSHRRAPRPHIVLSILVLMVMLVLMLTTTSHGVLPINTSPLS
jgi:hypothetical protein